MKFNFFGIRDSINFDSTFYYAVFCDVDSSVELLSDAQIFAAEVPDIARKVVNYSLTTNQISQEKIITLDSTLAESTSPVKFNAVILADETASATSGVQGAFILAKYQLQSKVDVRQDKPARINLNPIILKFD